MKYNKIFGILIILISCLMISSLVSANLTTDLISYYDFEGNAEDKVGSNNGTVFGATNGINYGKINKGYNFDGSNDYINLGTSDEFNFTDSFSISAWAYPKNINSEGAIVARYNYDNEERQYYLKFQNDMAIFALSMAGTNVTTKFLISSTVNTNQWYHLVGIYDKENEVAKLYLNSVLVDSAPITNNLSGFNQPVGIGRLIDTPVAAFYEGYIDEVGFWNRALTPTEVSNLYNSGDGLSPFYSPSVSNNIKNPSATIYPTINYDWNSSFEDTDYNSDYTYKYSFGFNYTNAFDGNEIYIDTNKTLDYDQNTSKDFNLSYTPIIDQIGDTNYSFFKVYRYLNGSYDSNYTAWSSDTFTVVDNINIDVNKPAYPDWAGVLYPTKSYLWHLEYRDKSYQTGITTYKYDFGINTTNTLNGNEKYWKQNTEINSTDGNISKYIPHTILEDDNDKIVYSFLTLKRYNNGVFVDSKTAWTDSFDINYGKFKIKFYDETTGNKLDGNVQITGDFATTVDENGEINGWLSDYVLEDGYAIQNEIWREISGGATHTKRRYDYYVYLTKSYDYNIGLLPINDGENVEFTARDNEDNLWGNKYLAFIKGAENIRTNYEKLTSNYENTITSNTKHGVLFKVKETSYLDSIKIKKENIQCDSWGLWDYNNSNLITTNDVELINNNVLNTRYPIKLDANKQYAILLFDKDGSECNYSYNNLLNTNIQREYVTFMAGCDSGETNCTSNNAYSILGINVIDGNNYEQFIKNNIIESKKLNEEGKGVFYIKSDGNYSAVLIDEKGSITTQYQKSKVVVKKPKDETTNSLISPYDITVNGGLFYNLQNLSDENKSFNVFAGTENYYGFSIIDYNATPADRKYLSSRYFVKVSMGAGYFETYTLQPYLINETDAVFLNVTVKNTIGTTIPGVQLLLYKYIDGKSEIISSQTADMLGRVTFAVYPNDDYYLYVYHNDILKLAGNNNIRITKDTDMTVTIDLLTEEDIKQLWAPTIDWKESKGVYNLNNENINVLAEIKSNYEMAGYSIELYNGEHLVYEDVVDLISNNYDLNYTINSELIEDAFLSGEIRIKIINNINKDATKTYRRLIAFTDRDITPTNAFTKAGEEIGQPLSTIMSILFVGILIAFAIFTGGVVDPRIITGLGLFGLAIFLFFGWLNSGVLVFGTDISVFIFVMVCIIYVLSLVRGGR